MVPLYHFKISDTYHQMKTSGKKVAYDYDNILTFPHCVGAMDKHVVIEFSIYSASKFYNYKGTFSHIILAVVDANYNFIYVSIGCQDRKSEGGVFKSNSFKKKS